MMRATKGIKSATLKSVLAAQAKNMSSMLLRGPSKHVNVTTSTHMFAKGIKEHVKGRLSLGAKLLQMGKSEKVFRRVFSVRQGEEFLKGFHCCLFTTAGPIPGFLFITTEKLAFCSDKPVLKLSSPTGESAGFRYKVIIPLRKIKRAIQTQNANKAAQKYLQVVTLDDFEFWFMGFLNYKKMFMCIQSALSQT